MRAFIRLVESLLRRSQGVFEFTDDPDCLLRLQITRVHSALTAEGSPPLPGSYPAGEVRVGAGDLVLELHLWNDHIPPLPAGGPDWGWANRTQRLFVRSLQAAAREMQRDPRFAGVKAVHAISVLFAPSEAPGETPGGHSGGARLMQRLGFVIVPCRNPLGQFGEFWENFYAWWLMWAFNKVSVRHRQFWRMRRMEAWMPAETFIRRFGGS